MSGPRISALPNKKTAAGLPSKILISALAIRERGDRRVTCDATRPEAARQWGLASGGAGRAWEGRLPGGELLLRGGRLDLDPALRLRGVAIGAGPGDVGTGRAVAFILAGAVARVGLPVGAGPGGGRVPAVVGHLAVDVARRRPAVRAGEGAVRRPGAVAGRLACPAISRRLSGGAGPGAVRLPAAVAGRLGRAVARDRLAVGVGEGAVAGAAGTLDAAAGIVPGVGLAGVSRD